MCQADSRALHSLVWRLLPAVAFLRALIYMQIPTGGARLAHRPLVERGGESSAGRFIVLPLERRLPLCCHAVLCDKTGHGGHGGGGGCQG